MSRRALLPIAIAICLASGCGREERRNSNQATGKAPQFEKYQKRHSLLDRTAGAAAPSRNASAGAFGEESGSTNVAVNSSGSGLLSFGDVDLGSTGLAKRSSGLSAALEGDEQVRALDLRTIELTTVSDAYKERYERGQMYLGKKDFTQALLCFQEAQELDNKSIAAYVGEAMCYTELKDYGKAQAAIDFAIRAAPQNAALYGSRAMIRYRRGDLQGCVDDFTRVLAENPKDYVCLLNRANVSVQMNNLKQAAADFTTILRDNPRAVDCLLNRSVVNFRMSRWLDSIADANEVTKLAPQEIDPYFLRAVSYARMGKPEAGKADYDKAVQLGLDKKMAEGWRLTFYPPGKP